MTDICLNVTNHGFINLCVIDSYKSNISKITNVANCTVLNRTLNNIKMFINYHSKLCTEKKFEQSLMGYKYLNQYRHLY